MTSFLYLKTVDAIYFGSPDVNFALIYQFVTELMRTLNRPKSCSWWLSGLWKSRKVCPQFRHSARAARTELDVSLFYNHNGAVPAGVALLSTELWPRIDILTKVFCFGPAYSALVEPIGKFTSKCIIFGRSRFQLQRQLGMHQTWRIVRRNHYCTTGAD